MLLKILEGTWRRYINISNTTWVLLHRKVFWLIFKHFFSCKLIHSLHLGQIQQKCQEKRNVFYMCKANNFTIYLNTWHLCIHIFNLERHFIFFKVDKERSTPHNWIRELKSEFKKQTNTFWIWNLKPLPCHSNLNTLYSSLATRKSNQNSLA